MIVGLFFATWLVAMAVWKLGRIEEKWTAGLGPAGAGPDPGTGRSGAGHGGE